jgi:hypothetical protein
MVIGVAELVGDGSDPVEGPVEIAEDPTLPVDCPTGAKRS